MKNQAMTWTDKELEALEKRIKEAYERASKEVTEKMERYLERFAKQDAVMAQKLQDGLITKQEYTTWRTNHFMMGKNWETMRDTLATDLVNADKIASKMINESLVNVYAENANYAAYEIEKGANVGLSFSLYDKKAVENLLSDNPNFIPTVNPKIPIDERWNRQHIASEMLQGILQGESIPKISKRLANVTTMDKNGAIRNARTYTTSIENQAKMDRYGEAEEMGIDLDKEWMATLDERTRESHRELDGERRANDEAFSNGCMYPADPSGDPEEIYNCRCRIVARIKGHNYDRSGRYGKFDDTSYEEWKKAKAKEEGKEEVKEATKHIDFTPANTIEEAQQYAKDNFVVDSQWSGEGNVSYKGLSLDNANQINEELTRLFAETDVPKFRNIGMMNFRQNIWKDAKDAPMAYRPAFNGDLFFNPNILKSEKTLFEYMEKGKDAFNYCVNNMDKFNGKQLELVKQYAEAGRQTVADSSNNPLKAMLDHEFGHHVDHSFILKNKDYAQTVKDGMEEYGIKLSGYALHSKGEYVAESFCAYKTGLGNIDPALEKIFNEVSK